MSAIKIIYLDFDGVLHPSTTAGKALFCRASLLEAVFDNPTDSLAVGIVISSSWRFTQSIKSLKAKLPSFLAQRVIDVTGPAVIGKHARYQEIIAHTRLNNEIVTWRALDDSYWEFPNHCPELIGCNPNTGIGPKEVAQLTNWLADQSS